MKKSRFLFFTAALFAAMTFTACEPANSGDDGEGPEGDGTVRLIDKIEYSGDDEWGYKFSYDSQNRLTKAEYFDGGDDEGEYQFVTYAYGANTLTVNREWKNNDIDGDGLYDWAKCVTNWTYNLNSDGLITSMASFSEKYWENDVYLGEDNETGSIVRSYKDGYLAKMTDSWSNTDDQYGGYTVYSVNDFVWNGGNLIKIEKTSTLEYDDDRPDEVTESEDTCTYGNQANPAKVSLDLNAYVILAKEGELPFAEAMGFFGKSPSKLITSYTYSEDDYTYSYDYTWELDIEGYITKMTVEGSYDTEVMTVTYK
jgi:hypothetical protein